MDIMGDKLPKNMAESMKNVNLKDMQEKMKDSNLGGLKDMVSNM